VKTRGLFYEEKNQPLTGEIKSYRSNTMMSTKGTYTPLVAQISMRRAALYSGELVSLEPAKLIMFSEKLKRSFVY
jgi:hypothetical protein